MLIEGNGDLVETLCDEYATLGEQKRVENKTATIRMENRLRALSASYVPVGAAAEARMR